MVSGAKTLRCVIQVRFLLIRTRVSRFQQTGCLVWPRTPCTISQHQRSPWTDLFCESLWLCGLLTTPTLSLAMKYCPWVPASSGTYPLSVPGFSEPPNEPVTPLSVPWPNTWGPESLLWAPTSIHLTRSYLMLFPPCYNTLKIPNTQHVFIHWNWQKLAILLAHLVPSHKSFYNWPPEAFKSVTGQETMRGDPAWKSCAGSVSSQVR